MTEKKPGGEEYLSDEIESALEGMNLQEIDLPSSRAVKRGAGERGEEGGPAAPSRLTPGVIVGVSGDDVIVELGPRMQGVISSAEFEEEPKVGETYQFSLRSKDPESDLWLLSRKEAMTLAKWQELEVGRPVKAVVTGQNTGGLELKIGPLSAFMPASHVSLRHVEDLSVFIGEAMVVEVLEVDVGRKRCTVSRRSVLRREREQARAETMETLTSGQVVKGRVTRVEAFGAFLEIAPGVEGLLHVSEISRQRVEDPKAVLKEGETLEVMVKDITEGGQRISLSKKLLEPDPWDDLVWRLPANSVVSGKVVKIMEFGAFVEIEPGVEGLLHVSQLGTDRVRRVQDAVKVGEELAVRVIAVEPERERISLSRLDPHGAVIGSEDAADASLIEEVIDRSEPDSPSLGTNLGNLFKKALGGE